MANHLSKKIAVVLSGCGFKDGAEITEAVSALIALSEAGAEYQIFAPNKTFTATDHLAGKSGTTDERNILTESARIARGQIKDLAFLNVKDFDGVVFPGGYGAATQLCTFGQEGAKGSVLPDVKRVILEFHKESKPICAICIAPALVSLVLGSEGVTVTIGDDTETAAEIEKTGASHEVCAVTDYVTDREHKLITTPAYMYEAKPFEIFTGVRAAIRELVEMA